MVTEISESEYRKILELANNVRLWVNYICDGPWGMCADAGIKVSAELQRLGIEHEFICGIFQGDVTTKIVPRGRYKGTKVIDEDEGPGAGHCWIQFPQWGGLVLDITADQFDESLPQVWFPAPKQLYHQEERTYHPGSTKVKRHVRRSYGGR